MASNNFFPWGDNAGNIMSNADYESNIQRTDGVELGLADPALHNRLYRQVSLMAAAIGQIIADSGLDANDGNMAELVSALKKVFARWGGGEFSGKIICPEIEVGGQISAKESIFAGNDNEAGYKSIRVRNAGSDGIRNMIEIAVYPSAESAVQIYKGADIINAIYFYNNQTVIRKPISLSSGGFGRKFSSEDDLKNYLKQLLGI